MDKNEMLRDALAAFVAEQQRKKEENLEYITNAAIGKALGYSNGSIVSQYLGDKPFQGKLDKFESLLASYLGFEAKAEDFAEKTGGLQRINPRVYVPTGVSGKIYEAIEYCRLVTGISVLHGDAGIGKTMAAKQYVRDNRGAAVLIKAEEGCIRRHEVIIELARRLGVKDAKNPAERYRAIRDKLHKGRKVIIFDEAHRFPLQTLDFIRDLAEEKDDENDNVWDGAGLVLIGNTKASRWLSDIKRDDMEQFRNRMIWEGEYHRRNTTLEDVRMVFTYLAQNDMNKELKALWEISSVQSLGLRGAVKIYNNAVNAGDVSYEGLRKICAQSRIGVI